MSSARSATAASRAVVRWAWRLYRRDWRAQLLVVALTTVAVAASVVGATMAVRAGTDPAGVFGRAGALVRVSGTPDDVQHSIDAARQRWGEIEVIGMSSTALPGSVERVPVRAQDVDGALGAPMLHVRLGRAPHGADEVALTPGVAAEFGATIGSTVDIDRAPRTVVGIVENPLRLNEQFTLVDPSGAPPADTTLILVANPSLHTAAANTQPVSGLVELRGSDAPGRVALVVVVITVTMVLAGLVAAAGFVAIAQRRQRQLGLLAAVGASRRHLGAVMVASGTLVGLTGALAGVALGVGGWQLVRRSVAGAAQRHLGALELPWPLVGLIVALAVVMSTAAAWWPARTASRIPVMAALSGRPVPPRPVHRPVLAALALLVAGGVALVASGTTQPEPNVLLLVGGLLAVILGVVVVTPAAVGVVGRLARRLPLAARIAVRDLSRFRSRAAAPLAAITLSIGISVGIVAIVAANADQNHSGIGNLPANALVVHLVDDRAQAAPTETADETDLDRRVQSVVDALGGSPTVTPLELVVHSSAGAGAPPVGVGRTIDAHSIEMGGLLYVATPEVLARYGIDPASIDPDVDLLTSDPDFEEIVDPTTRTNPATNVSIRDELPRYTAAPRALTTETAMARHGWQGVPGSWMVEADRPLTVEQLARARTAAAQVGMQIEARDTGGSDATVSTWATRVGVFFAVLIVLIAVALIRADAAGDLRTLTANGARPATRRNIAAATAATMGILGVILGVGGAYFVTVCALHAHLDWLWPAPWRLVVSVVVIVPALAALAAWLAGGHEPAAIGRRPLD